MQYVIWGAGYYGMGLGSFLEGTQLEAFIDSDPNKVGSLYCGKPIINFEHYLRSYTHCCVVISLKKKENIKQVVEVLQKHGVSQYVSLMDAPQELYLLYGFGRILFREFPFPLNPTKTYAIEGITLLSFLVYDYLKNCGCPSVSIIYDEVKEAPFSKWLNKHYQCYRLLSKDHLSSNIQELFITRYANEAEYANRVSRKCKLQNCYDFSKSIKSYYNPKLIKFNKIHSGAQCFIVGNGPSLRIKDLNQLYERKQICFAMNRISSAFPETKWRPTYFVCSDAIAARVMKDEIIEMNAEAKFITDQFPEFWEEYETKGLAHNVYRLHMDYIANAEFELKFQEDITWGSVAGGTATYVAMQLAVYMGFKTIFLLGIDCNYTSRTLDSGNHFTNNYYNKHPCLQIVNNFKQGTEWQIHAYERAKKYADTHGIKIYNATRGGCLDVFKRVDFDKLF